MVVLHFPALPVTSAGPLHFRFGGQLIEQSAVEQKQWKRTLFRRRAKSASVSSCSLFHARINFLMPLRWWRRRVHGAFRCNKVLQQARRKLVKWISLALSPPSQHCWARLYFRVMGQSGSYCNLTDNQISFFSSSHCDFNSSFWNQLDFQKRRSTRIAERNTNALWKESQLLIWGRHSHAIKQCAANTAASINELFIQQTQESPRSLLQVYMFPTSKAVHGYFYVTHVHRGNLFRYADGMASPSDSMAEVPTSLTIWMAFRWCFYLFLQRVCVLLVLLVGDISNTEQVLAPIRLSIDQDGIKFRDSFTWNVNDSTLKVSRNSLVILMVSAFHLCRDFGSRFWAPSHIRWTDCNCHWNSDWRVCLLARNFGPYAPAHREHWGWYAFDSFTLTIRAPWLWS